MLSRTSGRVLRYGNLKHHSQFVMQSYEGIATGGHSQVMWGLGTVFCSLDFYHEAYGGS